MADWWNPFSWFSPSSSSSKTQPVQTVPQKSTIISPPPQAPNMPSTITIPSTNKTATINKPAPTQTPQQFTPAKPTYSSGNVVSNKPADASYTQGTSVYNPATKVLESNVVTSKSNTPASSINVYTPTTNQQLTTAYQSGYGKEFGLPKTYEQAGSPFNSKFISSTYSPYTNDYGVVNYSPTYSGRGTIISIPQSSKVLSEQSKMDIARNTVNNFPYDVAGFIVPTKIIETVKDRGSYPTKNIIDLNSNYPTEKVSVGSQILGGVESGLFILPGASASSSYFKSSLLNLQTERELNKLGIVGYKGFELQLEGEKGAKSIVTAKRSYGGLTENVKMFGAISETSTGQKFIPIGVGERYVSGVITSDYKNIFKTGDYIFSAGEKFNYGVKGFSVPSSALTSSIKLPDESIVSFARGTTIKTSSTSAMLELPKNNIVTAEVKNNLLKGLEKNYQVFDYGSRVTKTAVAGVSKQIDESTFLTKSGKINNINYFPGINENIGGTRNILEESLKINANLNDLTLTKISKGGFETTYDFGTSTTSRQINKNTFSNQATSSLLKESFKTTDLQKSSNILKTTTKSFATTNLVSSSLNVISSKTSSNQFNTISQLPSLDTSVKNTSASVLSSSLSTSLATTQKSNLDQTPKLFQPSFQYSPQGSKTFQNQINIQIPKTFTPNINPSSPQPFKTPFSIPAIPPFWLPSGSLESMGSSRRFRGKQRKKYTPSYEALIFNIKGKQPKRITGAEIRPITKGFNWNFNNPSSFGLTKIPRINSKFKYRRVKK